jgi:MFS family permease
MAVFVISPFISSALGPIASGYIAARGISWRWVYWIDAMFAGVCFFLTVFAIPETYAPVLLVKKAKALRKETGDKRFTAALERQNIHWRAQLRAVLGRPFKIMFLEPLLMVLTFYMSVRFLSLFAKSGADNAYVVCEWDSLPTLYRLPCHFH